MTFAGWRAKRHRSETSETRIDTPICDDPGRRRCRVQITLQLRPKDAVVIKRIALSERQTPRRVAQQMLRDALAKQTDQGGTMT
jgi:hypothetical protein